MGGDVDPPLRLIRSVRAVGAPADAAGATANTPPPTTTVGGSELGSLDLAAKHIELVAQDGDLDVLGVVAAKASEQHANEPACHEVKERQGHRPIVPYLSPCCSAHSAGFLNPTGSCTGAPS